MTEFTTTPTGTTEFVTTERGDRVAFDRYGPGAAAASAAGTSGADTTAGGAASAGAGAPGLVFVAGAGPFRAGDPVTTETAQRVAEHGITTVVFDRLGRGESPAEGVLDLARELDAIAAAIEAAGGSAVLCGHSSGCSLALAAAVAGLPVAGLALWEIPTSDSAADTAAWNDGFERLLDDGDPEAAQLQYMRDMPPEFLENARTSPAWPAIVANARTLRADGQSLAWATEALEEGGLGAIEMPVLLMYGTETFPVMPLAADRVAAAIEGATVKAVAGAMHSWDPTAMAGELAAFVRACAAS